MAAQYIWQLGSAIFLILGSIHLFYTFFTDKFSSRNENVLSEMRSSSPNLTRETTIWRAWIGFNASHSSGAIFIGVVNLYVAQYHFSIIQDGYFWIGLNLVTVAFYLWLAKRYWFSIPFIGILLTLICFVSASFMAL